MSENEPQSKKAKPPGRVKGSKNKRTVEFMQALERNNFDPAEALMYCFRQSRAIFEARKRKGNLAGALVAMDRMIDVSSELAQFAYPKKKAIEHSGEVNVKTFADFIATGLDDDGEENED